MRSPVAQGLVFVLVLAAAGGALAGPIYKWVDKDGQEHYTNDPASIPAGEKPTVTEGAQLNELTVTHDDSEPPRLRQRRNAPEEESQANDEQAWRARFKRAHDRISELETRVAQDQQKADAAKDVTTSYTNGRQVDAPEARTRAQLKQDQAALQRAKGDLEELERRASKQSIPREWRE